MAQSRKERKLQFEQEMYLAASFFKMKSFSNGESALKFDDQVNKCGAQRPFPHPLVETKHVSTREPWRKMTNIVRDPDQIRKLNSSGAKDGTKGEP